jgi:hypothetical protein
MSNGGSENQSPLVTRHSSLLPASYPALDALLLIFILSLALQTPTEPDFGWHLRTGLDLLQHGWQMPMTDPYSHTMPDWPWVEHAWLTDGVIALIHRALGGAGLLGAIVFFAAVTVGAFAVAAWPARADRTSKLIAVAAALWVARPFLGARTQLVTLLGFALVLWMWHRSREGRLEGRLVWLWAMPPLFLLWGNLHGGFTAGLFTLALILAVSAAARVVIIRWPEVAQQLEEPVPVWPQIGCLALAIGAATALTFVNPYGWRLYQEILQSLSDRFMLETLHEWQPLSLQTYAGTLYAGYLAGLGAAMGMGYRRIEPIRWVVLAVFLGLSLRHWRNVPFFLIVSLPLVAEMLTMIATRVVARRPAAARHPRQWGLVAALVVAIGLSALGPEHLTRVVRSGLAAEEFFRDTSYPIEAVQWIKANRDQVGARMFNEYGHGGFLLWWLPGERIFIDGRMPAWRIDDRRIFEDYLALTNWDPPALGVLDKYLVDWALVKRESPLERALGGERGWRRIYEDAKVRIYVRHPE